MAPKLEKILYAEDDADIRTIAVLAMEVLGGMKVETCDSGVNVVEKAHEFKPDLILLDVMMPNVDGPTALGQLRQVPELSKIPVVFITAKVMKEEVAEFRELGAVDIIEKPFDPQSLTEQINAIWDSTHG